VISEHSIPQKKIAIDRALSLPYTDSHADIGKFDFCIAFAVPDHNGLKWIPGIGYEKKRKIYPGLERAGA